MITSSLVAYRTAPPAHHRLGKTHEHALRIAAVALGALFVGCSAYSEPVQEAEPASQEQDAHVPSRLPLRAAAFDSSALAEVGFTAVWGSGPSDVWAVGSEGTIAHYDGRSLRQVESPTDYDILGVSGNGPDDVWIVGDRGATFHWNGSTFEDHSGTDDEVLMGVWTAGPSNVWIVGSVPADRAGLVRWYDGDKMREQEVPGSTSLWEIWGSGPNDIWMVGTSASIEGLALHGDGESFAPVDMAGGPLRGVWGSSARDVWVVPYDTELQHWNGEALQSDDTTPEAPMLAVWGTSRSNVWAVGLEGTIRHFDGKRWSPYESGTDVTLWAVWGHDAEDAWAVGGSGTLLRFRGREWKPLEAALDD